MKRVLLAAAAALALCGSASAQQVITSYPSRGQIPGGTGVAANAGNIGEAKSITAIPCSTTTGLTSGAYSAIGTITLTAGTWTLYGAGGVDLASGTTSQCTSIGISSSNSGFTPSSAIPGSVNACFGYGNSGSTLLSGVVVLPNVTVTTSTPYYLTINPNFTGGTAGSCGNFWATRIQ